MHSLFPFAILCMILLFSNSFLVLVCYTRCFGFGFCFDSGVRGLRVPRRVQMRRDATTRFCFVHLYVTPLLILKCFVRTSWLLAVIHGNDNDADADDDALVSTSSCIAVLFLHLHLPSSLHVSYLRFALFLR